MISIETFYPFIVTLNGVVRQQNELVPVTTFFFRMQNQASSAIFGGACDFYRKITADFPQVPAETKPSSIDVRRTRVQRKGRISW